MKGRVQQTQEAPDRLTAADQLSNRSIRETVRNPAFIENESLVATLITL